MQKPKPSSFEELRQMDIAALAALAKNHVTDERQVAKKAEALKGGHRQMGKVIAAMKIKHAEAVDGGAIAKGKSFREYHKAVAGDFPNNHAEQCAVAFNGYVLSGLIAESDYDLCALDWLEKAASILNLCKGNLGASQVIEAAELLKTRPDKGAKELAEIKKSLKPAKEGDEETGEGEEPGENVVREITPGIVSALLRDAFNRGLHSYVIAELISEIHHVQGRAPNIQQALFDAGFDMGDAWANSGVPSDTLNAWAGERDKRNAPPVELQKAA